MTFDFIQLMPAYLLINSKFKRYLREFSRANSDLQGRIKEAIAGFLLIIIRVRNPHLKPVFE
jgi:hypothetical protein